MDLQTVPIVGLVVLGRCPEMPIACLSSLAWVSPSLTLSQHQGELCGPHTCCAQYCTKDGLVLVVNGVRHIATLTQGRWRLLAGACNASGVGEKAQREYVESVCSPLPGWVWRR